MGNEYRTRGLRMYWVRFRNILKPALLQNHWGWYGGTMGLSSAASSNTSTFQHTPNNRRFKELDDVKGDVIMGLRSEASARVRVKVRLVYVLAATLTATKVIPRLASISKSSCGVFL